ncbi:hypothetical protein RRG08_054980 [Elysia crispata]|uniref:Uncharacterized protein n=1 Tax=Elysia crispata TaxID=231223 RepID=A0AAE1DVI0_9GAST|nr:hypothetical protein RRG08_054980 [Elysia crispata]
MSPAVYRQNPHHHTTAVLNGTQRSCRVGARACGIDHGKVALTDHLLPQLLSHLISVTACVTTGLLTELCRQIYWFVVRTTEVDVTLR